jgi:diguanylate cyclase (GGDEF)-like protein
LFLIVAIANVLVGVAVAIVLITGSWRDLLKGLPRASWNKTQIVMRPIGGGEAQELPPGMEVVEVPIDEPSVMRYDPILVDLLTEQTVHRRQLLDLEHRLWGPHRPREAAELEAYCEHLRQTNQDYLYRQQSIVQALAHGADHSDDMRLGSHIELTLDEVAVQLQRIGNELARADFRDNLADATRRLCEGIQTALHSGHTARDAWREHRTIAARQENQGPLPTHARDDLTGLPDRSALEAELADWWQKEANRNRELSLAIIDIDGMAQINQQHGFRVGDQLLHVIAQIAKRELSGVDTLFCLAGQQFAVLSPDANPKAVGVVLEKIREQVAQAHLQAGTSPLRVTVSCGVTQAHPQETPDDFYQRATAAVTAAKLCGRNRTYVDRHDPAQVAPRAA